jgi:hypothetical protein
MLVLFCYGMFLGVRDTKGVKEWNKGVDGLRREFYRTSCASIEGFRGV